MRILHVIGGMGRGGMETWLMQVLRAIDRDRYRMDFLANTGREWEYDREIEALGSRVLQARPMRLGPGYWASLRDFRRVFRDKGPFDIVHAHNTVRYGAVLREAAAAGIPGRIIHSHSMQTHDRRWATRPFCFLARRWMRRHATVGLGCSEAACGAMFGRRWRQDPRWRVLYYGIDLAPYGQPQDRAGARAEFGIPSDALVVGHVGRFAPVKNHPFLLAVAGELVRLRPDCFLLLVGEGRDKPAIERQVRRLNLAGRVLFAGPRSDVPRMLSAMDVFVLPSHSEGLGIVLIEAQAMGLPCLISDTVTREVQVVGELCRWLSLSAGPAEWACRLLEAAASQPVSRSGALRAVKESRFNIRQSVAGLGAVYDEVVASTTPG